MVANITGLVRLKGWRLSYDFFVSDIVDLMEYMGFEEVGSSYDMVFWKISQLVDSVTECRACDQIVLAFLIYVPQQNTSGYLLRTQIKELHHVAL